MATPLRTRSQGPQIVKLRDMTPQSSSNIVTSLYADGPMHLLTVSAHLLLFFFFFFFWPIINHTTLFYYSAIATIQPDNIEDGCHQCHGKPSQSHPSLSESRPLPSGPRHPAPDGRTMLITPRAIFEFSRKDISPHLRVDTLRQSVGQCDAFSFLARPLHQCTIGSFPGCSENTLL
jgi:hypothetical protein